MRQDVEDRLQATQPRLLQRVSALEIVRLHLSFGIRESHLCHRGLGADPWPQVARLPGSVFVIDVASGQLEPLASAYRDVH